MDNYTYLQQISQSNRPVKPVKSTPKHLGTIIKILCGFLFATILLVGVVSIITSSQAQSTDSIKQLYVRMNNVSNIINDYNKSLKSSQLRAYNYSLSGTISGTAPQLATYLNATDDGSKNSLVPPANLLTEEGELYETTDSDLANAKLNGTLDRIYAAQIQMQVSLLMSLTGKVLVMNDQDPRLKAILDPFYSNLTVIEESLNTFTSE